jgi:cephalosporin hydroxylase
MQPKPPLTRRVKEFLRPRPRYLPLTPEEILRSSSARDLVAGFNDLFYTSSVAGELQWGGARMLKNPCDLWVVVELLQKLRPVALVETGTFHGGSACFYADLCRLFEIDCSIVTIDPDPRWDVDPQTRGIVSLRGRSTDPRIVGKVRALVDEALRRRADGAVMVTLDSDHSEENVFREMEAFGPLVTRGSYLIVEDTNVNGHPSDPGHGPGPWEAVTRFLAAHPDFEVDTSCERFLLTYNPRGWLRRVS